MKKKIIAIVACVAIIAAGIGLYFYVNPLSTNNSENVPAPMVSANGKTDKTTDNSKTIALTISADGKTETYEVKTDAETLGKMLVDEGYVKNDQESYGLYIKTVYGPFKDGRTVDTGKEEWWSLKKNGETLMTGADQTTISDGEKYELTLMVGYDNF